MIYQLARSRCQLRRHRSYKPGASWGACCVSLSIASYREARSRLNTPLGRGSIGVGMTQVGLSRGAPRLTATPLCGGRLPETGFQHRDGGGERTADAKTKPTCRNGLASGLAKIPRRSQSPLNFLLSRGRPSRHQTPWPRAVSDPCGASADLTRSQPLPSALLSRRGPMAAVSIQQTSIPDSLGTATGPTGSRGSGTTGMR